MLVDFINVFDTIDLHFEVITEGVIARLISVMRKAVANVFLICFNWSLKLWSRHRSEFLNRNNRRRQE